MCFGVSGKAIKEYVKRNTNVMALLSVHCNVQHLIEENINLLYRVRRVSVHPATMARIVSSDLNRSSQNLEHSFPLASGRKYFGLVPEMRGQVRVM